jgi:hypothetical protein
VDTATAFVGVDAFKLLVMKHKKAIYDKWRKEYDTRDLLSQA